MVLDDIRNTDPTEYSETLRKRWGGLLSYRYIGRQFSSMNNVERRHRHAAPRHAQPGRWDPRPGVLDQRSGRRRTVRSRSGAEPRDPFAADPRQRQRRTADRGDQVGDAEGRHPDVLRTRGDRRRRRPRRVLALIEGRVRRSATCRPGARSSTTTRSSTSRIRPTSPDLAGLRREQARRRAMDAGRAAGRVASPDAALHVGPQFVIHETAALDLAAELAGTDQLQPESDHFMFLARGKVGAVPRRGPGVTRHGRFGADRRAPHPPRRRRRRSGGVTTASAHDLPTSGLARFTLALLHLTHTSSRAVTGPGSTSSSMPEQAASRLREHVDGHAHVLEAQVVADPTMKSMAPTSMMTHILNPSNTRYHSRCTTGMPESSS